MRKALALLLFVCPLFGQQYAIGVGWLQGQADQTFQGTVFTSEFSPDTSSCSAGAQTYDTGVTTVPNDTMWHYSRMGASVACTTTGLDEGDYDVTLYWVDFQNNRARQRVFDVAINSTTVLTGLDVFSASGAAYTLYTRTFRVHATSSITISLTGTTGSAMLNAYVVKKSCWQHDPADSYDHNRLSADHNPRRLHNRTEHDNHPYPGRKRIGRLYRYLLVECEAELQQR